MSPLTQGLNYRSACDVLSKSQNAFSRFMLLTQLLYVKVKLEPKLSRVLHFRGVPLDVSDSEILQLSLPFGNVTNLVVSKKKNQVLLLTSTSLTSLSPIIFHVINRTL